MLHGSPGTLQSELFLWEGACVGLQVKLASSGKNSAAGDMTHSLLALSYPVTLCHKELLSIRNRATATEEHKFNLMNSV